MSEDIAVVWHDPTQAGPPPEWAAFAAAAQPPPSWRWSVVRAFAIHRRGAAVAATLLDGSTPIGLVAGRVRGLAPRLPGVTRRRDQAIGLPRLGLVELDCPGTSALPGLLLAAEPDAATWSAVVVAVERALRREYGRRVAAVAYRQVTASMLPAVLRQISLVHQGSPVAVLENRFDDYAAYLRSLRGSRRRDQMRLVRRFDEDPSLSIEFGRANVGARPMAARLGVLVGETERRHTRPWRWQPDSGPAVDVLTALLAEPDVYTLTYRDKEADELVGCMVLHDHPWTPVMAKWGSHPPRAGARSGMYFDMMARTVRWFVEAGRPLLICGKALSDVKAALGFSLRPQWAVVHRLSKH